MKVSDTREVEMDQVIPNKHTSSFCEKGMKVDIMSMAPAETNYSGLFYDHQRAVDTTGERKGYDFYLMNHRKASIVMVLTLKFFFPNGDHTFTIENFTSIRFSSLFQGHQFPALTYFSELDKTDSSDILFDCITKIVHYINLKKGFNFTGWYKKRLAKYNYNNESNAQITVGSISVHPVSIVPTNIDDVQQTEIDILKFHVGTMHITTATD